VYALCQKGRFHLVTVYYMGGPLNGETADNYPTIKCEWKSTCEHIAGDEEEGFFVISRPVKDARAHKGYFYEHIDCELCARRKGIIW
jgi:hypothetical protein